MGSRRRSAVGVVWPPAQGRRSPRTWEEWVGARPTSISTQREPGENNLAPF